MSVREWFLNKYAIPGQITRRWVEIILVSVVLIGLPLGLSAAQWLRLDTILWWATAGGVICGLALAGFIHRPALMWLLAAVAGVLFVVQFQGRVLPPLRLALGELGLIKRWAEAEALRVLIEAFHPAVESGPALPLPALPEWHAAWERLSLYWWNVQADWPPVLVPRYWGSGQMLLGSALGLLTWMATAVAVWSLARQRSVWSALTPALTLLTVSLYYTWKGWGALIAVLCVMLLLAGASTLHRLEKRWGSGFPEGVTLDWWAASAAIALMVGITMGLTVGVTDPEFREWVDDTLFPDRTASAGGGTSTGGTEAGSQPDPGIWPRQHLLNTGPELSEQPVMTVRTPGVPPAGFYWRATSYDEYTGRGWISNASGEPSPDSAPLWPLSPEPPPGFILLRQSYRLESPTHQIYAAGRPVRLNHPASGFWLDPERVDLVSVESINTLSAYEVLSWVSTATADDLRAAAGDYPSWVTENYLALPENLPERVVALAHELTADIPAAYDRALALQSYLRSYEYTLALPLPPDDRDVVDYFLFDLRKGYCDYYASALVVMARSVGLPARLAVGYATGEYIPQSETYRVTLANGHSWAEIYFPGYGWIPFEATAALPAIEHGLSDDWATWIEASPPIETWAAFERESTSADVGVRRRWLLIIIALLTAAIAGGAVLISLLNRRRQRRRPPGEIIALLYMRLLKRGQRLGIPISATQTPGEFLAKLHGELSVRAQAAPRWGGNWGLQLERARRLSDELVQLYSDACYSPRRPSRETALAALDAWPLLDRALWLFRLAGSRQPSR